jgi:hypothetical protein
MFSGVARTTAVATAVVLATPENMNEPAVRRLLRPDLSILVDRD